MFSCVRFFTNIIAILFLAITNSVNLTDGLDGLASSVSATYLFSFAILLILQEKYFDFYPLSQELASILRLCFSSIGALLGFLVFNSNKASVFMGDTGSLALGGLLATIAIMGKFELWLIPIAIVFICETFLVCF